VSRRRTTKRTQLIEELDRENRRLGSVGALHAKALAERAGLNGTDWECLDVLDWTGPITAGELARRVGITSGAVTGAIDRLERGGWVRRAADPTDRRKVMVELVPPTPDGPQAARYSEMVELFGPLQVEIAELIDRFDDDQLETVLDYLRGANEAVERSIDRSRHRRSDWSSERHGSGGP
jgi:DNA-binding MarR family transcriptional regulator